VNGELFDEDFFSYREDADLAWRAQILGWKCLYVPSAVAWHERRVTPERRRQLPHQINWHSVKNRFIMRAKNASFWLGLRFFFPIAVRDLLILGFTLLRDWKLFSALVWPLMHVGQIHRKRKWVQSHRRVSDRELARWFSNTPHAENFQE
jgi:GT2 family glycosyltransferase